jgi:fibro-slime domain-containing protein
VTANFPEKIGECQSRKITALFRDWHSDSTSPNPSFGNGNVYLPDECGHKNMVQNTLVAPDYKPKVTNDSAVDISCLGHLETWYITDTFPSGSSRMTNDTSIDLEFKKGEYFGWEYDSDWMGKTGFFPLDSFINNNNIPFGDLPDSLDHNFYFTMEMHFQFIYRNGFSHKIYAQGGDDIWVFVNRHLAIDLGGIQQMGNDSINLDSAQTDLELIDGTVYIVDIFFAERCAIGSDFKLQTTLDIYNPGEVTEMKPQRKISSKYYHPAELFIPVRSVSGKYFSITGKKLWGKTISPQPLIKVGN